MKDRRTLRSALALAALFASTLPATAQTFVTKYIYEFDTLGAGHPNDLINDHQAFLNAAAFFQFRGGYGTLLLEDGEYIVGKQQLHWYGDPLPAPWTAYGYPSDDSTQCKALVAIQPGFTLEGCSQFTVQGGANTTVRYRDCLYYGTFLRTPGTDEVFSAAGVDGCRACNQAGHLPELLHAEVGVMFSFSQCDSVTVRDLELNGNIDGAILGGRSSSDGIQTGYDGILLFESSNCVIDHVDAHHFGKDGIQLAGSYPGTGVPFADAFPGLDVGIDPADSLAPPSNRTVIFNNRILNSSFNWNGRQGFSWTGLAGLQVSNCDLNYNGAGRMTSQPGSGLDIEGVGGPMRVRHGSFSDCRFLHNRAGGVISFDDPCLGQQDFTFTNCTIKAGTGATALWPSSRGMRFYGCEIYGHVEHMFEQAEDIANDSSFNLVFHKTNFHEEDDQWSYLGDFSASVWDSICGGGPVKVDMVGIERAACVTFDSCSFFTNCRGKIRLAGRSTVDTEFPYCSDCTGCPYLGTDTAQDARYITVTDCTFRNTGRMRCTDLTEVLAIDLANVDGFAIDIPTTVRGGGIGDVYSYPFGTAGWLGPTCYPYYCDWDTVITTDYGGSFPPCLPFFTLPDTIAFWDLCDSTNNVLVQACSSDANCYSDRVIPDSSLASAIGTVFTGTVDIQGLFTVDDDVLFYNADVRMEPGAEIIVQDGWTLDIDNSSFTACNGIMWKSITAEDGSTVRMWDSFMDDAESTVSALDGSTVWIDNTQFHNNRVAISIPDVGLSYNNVACWVSNSTFYSAGTMPLPYPGQTSVVGTKGFAAADVYNTTFDFTGGNNVVHSLSNGIVAHRSDVNVSDCRMLNIQPDPAYDYSGNGTGIFARGDHGFFNLNQQGYGMSGTPGFDGCRWGIYTEYMNVYSTDNNMADMGTAYRVDRSGYRGVDILNNHVYTHYNGIELRTNDGAAHILVEGNDITFGDDNCTNCKGWYAIYVAEGNMANGNSVVRNNTIHFLPKYASRFGIGVFAADDWLVAGNDLQMTSNAFNLTGIWLNGCRRPEVSCNTVTGAGLSYPVPAQAAIRNNMGKEPLISCNDVNKTANGLLFNGVAPYAEVRGNFLHNHKWPLHLDGTAVIGTQIRKGNLWYNPPAAGGWGAWYEVPAAQALLHQFLYNPDTISGGSTQPPSWSPITWFTPDPGSNYDCANDLGMDYCSQFHDERCKGCLTDLDEKIAGDSLENDPYTDETKWMLKGDLYKKLDDEPALLDSLALLADFYADLQGSTSAAFKAIDDEQLALYDLDSTVVEQLEANSGQIDSLLVLVQDGLEELGDSTLSATERQAILDGISGYRESIRDLSASNAMVVQAVATTKVLAADAVKSENADVATSELIETNEKTVNDIYLATVGKDVDTFTSAQAGQLFDIASQCPMLGGNAVFKARSLYWLIDDTQDFDDSLLCLPYGINVKSLTEQTTNAIAVIPNPASDEAALVLDHGLYAPGMFVVYDALGAEVMRQTVPVGIPRLVFSTASLAPALYHYQVRGPSGVLGGGNLTIVR